MAALLPAMAQSGAAAKDAPIGGVSTGSQVVSKEAKSNEREASMKGPGNGHVLVPFGAESFALILPAAARTATSLAVLWPLPKAGDVEAHEVYLDGARVAAVDHTDYTFEGLSPATRYEVAVVTRLKDGTSLRSVAIQLETKERPQEFDITAFGAVGDGKTLNTRAIQAAIDACVAGGCVRIPAGVFVAGALFLKSDMTLHLAEGAVLLGSGDEADYPLMTYRFEGRELLCHASLVGTPEAKGQRWHDITIEGKGTINANGVALRKNVFAKAVAKPGRAVSIRDTDRVYLKDITVRQAPFWCVHPVYCTELCVNGVSIHQKYDEAGRKYAGMVNGDGLDPDSCRGVYIFNSLIASQDDCIALKSGRDAEGRAVGIPTENVRITHCRFVSGFGVAVGSEMAGGIRNVLVEDCVFENTFSIASIKAPRGRGNVIEAICYRDCSLVNRDEDHHDGKWFRGALYVDQFYGDGSSDPLVARPVDEGTATIRNVLFQNIRLDTVGGTAIYLSGLPERPLEGIRLDQVTAIGEQGFVAYNVRGLELNSVSVEARKGKAMRMSNVK